jgi:hypothetical protein
VHYTTATATQTLVVNQAKPKITWPKPASIMYPTPVDSTQLDATASVPGTFSYNVAPGAVLSAGGHALVAVFTPTDTTNYAPVTAKTALTVTKPPTRTVLLWEASVVYGGEQNLAPTVSVTSSDGAIPTGKVVIKATSSSGAKTILCTAVLQPDGNGACTTAATRLQPGTYTVQASYAATLDFGASSSASAPLTVTPAPTVLSAVPVVLPSSGTHNVTFTATLTSQVTGMKLTMKSVVFTLGSQTCTGGTGMTGVATCTIPVTGPSSVTSFTASYAGNVDYQASSDTESAS